MPDIVINKPGKRALLLKRSLLTTFVLAAVFTAFIAVPAKTQAYDYLSSINETYEYYVKHDVSEPRVLSSSTVLSQGQRNIVLRARQVNEIEWTPLKDVPYFAKKGYFKAGVTIKGMPYSRPLEENYVPAKTSLSVFAAAVKNINSPFYTINEARGNTTPYYGLDCSGLVTFAWGLETRHMTTALHRVSANMGRNINTIQVGDSLNKSGTHATLITEVRRDSSGNVTTIGLMELVQPSIRYTLFGQGGTKPLSDINRQFLNNGYSILRYNHRDSVRYFHDCAIPIDNDDCDKCKVHVIVHPIPPFTDIENEAWYVDTVKFVLDRGIFSGTGPVTFSPGGNMTRAMFASMLSKLAGADISGYTGMPFLDTPRGAWYGKAVEWAADAGIIQIEYGFFEPDRYVTREETAIYIYNYLLWTEAELPDTGHGVIFDDDEDISEEAKEVVYMMRALGILNGDGKNRFNPFADVTRAEMAQVIRNLLLHDIFRT